MKIRNIQMHYSVNKITDIVSLSVSYKAKDTNLGGIHER